MKTDVLMAIGPGDDWASVSRSRNSSCASHRRRLITSASMSGTMAYPPPKVNMPILKKLLKSSKSEVCSIRCLLSFFLPSRQRIPSM